MEFKVGDIITPTNANPWVNIPNYVTMGQKYEVVKTSPDYVYIIKNDGTEDGFPSPEKTKLEGPFFVLVRRREDRAEFSEDEISKAMEFLES